jgi:hypothetical protein
MGEGASHWWSGLPFYEGLPVLARTRNVEERATRAALFRQRAKVSERILVDEDNDRSVHRLYGAPDNINALFAIDLKGRVVVKVQGRMPAALDSSLDALLAHRPLPPPPPFSKPSWAAPP